MISRLDNQSISSRWWHYFSATILVHHWCASTWRFRTGLCEFLQKISTNTWSLGKRQGLKLGEVSSLFFFFYITISHFFFHWMVFDLFFHCVTVKTISKRVLCLFLKISTFLPEFPSFTVWNQTQHPRLKAVETVRERKMYICIVQTKPSPAFLMIKSS